MGRSASGSSSTVHESMLFSSSFSMSSGMFGRGAGCSGPMKPGRSLYMVMMETVPELRSRPSKPTSVIQRRGAHPAHRWSSTCWHAQVPTSPSRCSAAYRRTEPPGEHMVSPALRRLHSRIPMGME